MRLNVHAQYLEICRKDEEGETYPNCGVKRMRVRMQPRLPFWEWVRNAPPAPGQPGPYSCHKELRSVRLAEETNDIMREIIEDRRRYQLSSVRGFIGPLPRPIGLLDESVREGSRVCDLPSPFLDPLYGRNIVAPFPVVPHLQQYHIGTFEHRVC